MIDNPAAMNNSSLSSNDPVVSYQFNCEPAIGPLTIRLLAAFEGLVRESSGSRELPFFWFRRARKDGVETVQIHIHDCPDCGDRHKTALGDLLRDMVVENPDRAADEDARPAPNLADLGYARTPDIFGGPPFTEDDEYIGLATQFLGAGCRWSVQFLSSQSSSDKDGSAEKDLFFVRWVAHCLSSMGLSDPERAAFLLYYRNWLIRFPLLMKRSPQSVADQWVEKLQDRAASDPERAQSIRRATTEAVGEDWLRTYDEATPLLQDSARSQHSICGRLSDYLASKADQPEYSVDPFSENLISPPVCKLVLGLSNALGYATTDQALLFHLMLQAIDASRAEETIPLQPIPR